MEQNSKPPLAPRNLRWLIWTYFWLLLFEGALRKWVAPQWSDPLLIIRDPVVLLIYLFAWKADIFPRNGWTLTLGMIGFVCFIATLLQLSHYLPLRQVAFIDLYGLRSNFLHLPLIFVMARAFNLEDVQKFGWFTLLLLIPMTLLLVAQFRAAPDAFLNRTAGGEGEMMLSALGKVRTAGTFSFVTGVVAFYALATGYIIWGVLKPGIYRPAFLFSAAAALVIGAAVSGSRSVVGACALVVSSLLAVLFLRPGALNRFGRTLIVVGVLTLILTELSIFHEGVAVLTARFNEVAEASQQTVTHDVFTRAGSGFREGILMLARAPLWGYGLGLGTNAAAHFLTGQSVFLLAETEWSRVFLENGPILGVAYVFWRVALAIYLGAACLRSLRQSELLPLLLFSSAVMPLVIGQFGQPTVLGFAVFTAGLTLAACQTTDEPISSPLPEKERRMRGRSPYAERLHSQSGNHGAVDR